MKYIYLLIFISFLFTGCKENATGNNETDDELYLTEEAALKKKGAAFSYRNKTWSSRISRLKAHWHYSWGLKLQPTRPEGVEFVPMFWGKWTINDNKQINYITDLVASGEINYVLGFNEPDREDQANMTVQQAVDLWPKLEALNIPLVSPAPANWNRAWMGNFMKQVEENNLRVDYIAIHWYGPPNAENFIQMLRKIYYLYDRPIWITEFAVADWQANSIADNRYSKEQVLDFMKTVLPQLDKLPFVYRYSWFNGKPNGRVLGNSVLFDENDELTELGHFYANHSPNLDAGPGDDSWYNGSGDDDNDGENDGKLLFSIEAEDADLTNAGVTAMAEGCSNKSGTGIIFMNGPGEGEGDRELKISDISIETAGSYDLEITYFAKADTQLEVIVNQQDPIIETGFGTPGFCFETSSRTVNLEVELEAGTNQLTFSPVQWELSPYLDKFAIYSN
mgnify:CR=1 FL=1